MKNLAPKEPSRPYFISKNGIQLIDSFYWIIYTTNAINSICSVHNHNGMAYFHGDGKGYKIEELLEMELKEEFTIVGRIDPPGEGHYWK